MHRCMSHRSGTGISHCRVVCSVRVVSTGLVWPVTGTKNGAPERSTSKTNRAIWAAASGAAEQAVGDAAARCRNWRFGYAKHAMRNVRLACRSPENATAIAKAGLAKAQSLFEFVRKGPSLFSYIEIIVLCLCTFPSPRYPFLIPTKPRDATKPQTPQEVSIRTRTDVSRRRLFSLPDRKPDVPFFLFLRR